MNIRSCGILLIAFGMLFSISMSAQTKLDSLLPVRGFSIDVPRPAGLDSFVHFIDSELAPRKVNTLIVQIEYHYQFKSHPELTDSLAISKCLKYMYGQMRITFIAGVIARCILICTRCYLP